MPEAATREHQKQGRPQLAQEMPHLRSHDSLNGFQIQRPDRGGFPQSELSSAPPFAPWLRQSPPRLMRSPSSGLAVNRPGDPYEQEADRVADQVMRMPSPVTLQRACAACNEEEHKLQRKCDHCEEEEKKQQLHRSETGAGPATAPSVVHHVLRSSGQPLDSGTRAFMEPRFGHSFGNIRVHTDPQAVQSAAAVNARAYTVGHDLVFASGEYSPHTQQGQRLLAHELAHTIQQGGTQPLLQRQETPGRAYDIELTYPPNQTESHHALSLPDAQRALRHFANRVDAHLEGGFEGHQYLWQIHNDQYIVAGISDLFGGRSIPPLSIWDAPRTLLTRARLLIDQGDVPAAVQELQEAARVTRTADRQVYEYREGTITGAERAVFGLQVVEVASAATISVATGGTAGVLLGAGYAGTQRLAGEISAVHYGLQERIDWAGVAFDTLFALVAGRFGGQLGNAIAGRISGAIVARFGEAAAARIASQITGRAISALIVGRGTGILHAAARELFDALRGATELTVQGFIDRLAEQLTVRAAFLDLVAAAAASGTESARTRSEAPPSTPRPSRRLSGPTRSIRGEAPGRVRVEEGRVVSSRSSGGRRTASGSTGRRVTSASAGRGGPALAVVSEPVTEPVAEPEVAPPLRVVPDAPPQPAQPPAQPAPSGVSAAVAITAATRSGSRRRTEPSPYTTPRVGTSPEPSEEGEHRGCTAEEGPQLGENNCHNAYAMSLSGVPREFALRTPEGAVVSYDALGRDQILYEVKTGYSWVPYTPNARAREQAVARFVTQSEEQLAVATRCGYPLIWIFNERAAAEFFDGVLQVPVEHRPFPCSIDSD